MIKHLDDPKSTKQQLFLALNSTEIARVQVDTKRPGNIFLNEPVHRIKFGDQKFEDFNLIKRSKYGPDKEVWWLAVLLQGQIKLIEHTVEYNPNLFTKASLKGRETNTETTVC
jgi:hypothetical protein